MSIRKKTLTFILTVWAFAVGVGVVLITDYAARPGAAGHSPAYFPTAGGKRIGSPRPALLVFAHPYCPCSRATFAELTRLNERTKGALTISVFFYQPPDQSPEWVESALWREAEAIPNITVAAANDEDLRKFGAVTSGQVILYDADNRLVFSGGITRARGHEGENDGRTASKTGWRAKPSRSTRRPCLVAPSIRRTIKKKKTPAPNEILRR